MLITNITPLLKTSTLNCLTVWYRSTYRYKLFPRSLQSEDPNDQQFTRSFQRPRARTTTIPPTDFWSGMNRLKKKKRKQFARSFRRVRARTIMIPPTDGCSRLLPMCGPYLEWGSKTGVTVTRICRFGGGSGPESAAIWAIYFSRYFIKDMIKYYKSQG